MKILLFLLAFSLSCTLSPSAHSKKMISSREILKKESKFLRGKLWDRSQFFLDFPFELLAMSLEKNKEEPDIASMRLLPSQDFYDKDMAKEMLQAKKPNLRGIALEFLTMQEKKSPAIVSALQDKEPYVKIVGMHMASQEDVYSLDKIYSLVKDKNEFVRWRSLSYAFHLHNTANKETKKKILALLHESFQDTSPLVRREAAKIVGIWKYSESILFLKKLSKDTEKYVRDQALQSLKNFSQ